MQTTIKPAIADWYNVLHTEDWQHELLEAGKQYYLIEKIKGHVEIVPDDDIRVYLDLLRSADDGWVAYLLDGKYPGWSTEVASGEE